MLRQMSFTNAILLGMNLFIPSSSKRTSRKQNTSHWMNDICRDALKKKEDAYRLFRSNRSDEHRQQYKIARNKCKTIIKRQRFLHNQKLRREILNQPRNDRTFWSFAKSVQNNFNETSLPPLICPDDITIVNSLVKANLFGKLFSENSSLSPTSQSPPEIPLLHIQMPKIYFRTKDIYKILLNLNIKKSSGPDSIPALVLKNIAESISKPLRNLFHLSYNLGIFPSLWKVSNVSPVPKKGNKSDPANYRPIAICSILSKVMETIINGKIIKFLEKNHVINDKQYGFRPKRSTGDLMTYITEKLSSSLHRQGESCMVALDISKAFDRVWHDALISKCRAIGLGQKFCKWIESFLKNRSIQVLVDGHTSSLYIINSGVPQGCVLSTTLFIIFINDLLTLTESSIHSYADDSTLTYSYGFEKLSQVTNQSVRSCRRNMINTVNKDLQKVADWGSKNRVNFNASKTQCCLFSRKLDAPSFDFQINFQGQSIERQENLNIVGTKLSFKLLWEDHIINKANTAAKMLGFLRRCKTFFSSKDLLTLYKAFIRSKMEDNSHIWAGASSTALKYLDSVQNRAIRLINDESITSSLLPLGHRRNIGALSIFYKYFVGMDSCSAEIKSILPTLKLFNRTTRLAVSDHPYYLAIPKFSTNYYMNSFLIRTSRMWNLLPSDVFPKIDGVYSFNLQKFKSNVNKLAKNISAFSSLSTLFLSSS